jgi:hypothetical protein
MINISLVMAVLIMMSCTSQRFPVDITKLKQGSRVTISNNYGRESVIVKAVTDSSIVAYGICKEDPDRNIMFRSINSISQTKIDGDKVINGVAAAVGAGVVIRHTLLALSFLFIGH